jgi:hypothetical protein
MRKIAMLGTMIAVKGFFSSRTICTNIRVSSTNALQFQSDNVLSNRLDPPYVGPPLKSHHYRSNRICEDCYHYLPDTKCALYPFVKNLEIDKKGETEGKFKLFEYDIDYLSCAEVRGDDSKCGKLGKRFEAM